MILLVQLNEDKKSVDLLFDKQGLDFLKEIVNKEWKEPVRTENEFYELDHEHLTSKDWGGNELTPEFTSKDAHKIESIKIVYLGMKGESLLS
jgi:hypothetical protein